MYRLLLNQIHFVVAANRYLHKADHNKRFGIERASKGYKLNEILQGIVGNTWSPVSEPRRAM